jgi:UDP-glucose 4-epimerase
MSVLVTGGAGYIGSVTVDALVDTGEDVVVLDDLSTGFADFVHEAARFVRGDIGDSDLVATLVDEYGIDACIHFAGKIAVGESVGNPAAYFDSNVGRPLRLLDALVESDVATLCSRRVPPCMAIRRQCLYLRATLPIRRTHTDARS